MAGPVHELEPTMGLALRAWWAFTWRSFLLAFSCSVAVGFVFGLLAGILGVGRDSISLMAGIAGALLGAYVSVRVMRRLMIKGFGDFRIVVVEK